MSSTSHRVTEFFEQLERNGNTLDLARIAAQYDDVFMFADPNGTRVVEKQKFLAALPRRREFFKALGHQSTRFLSLAETVLDDHYMLVRVQVLMHFEKESAQPIDAQFDTTYILYIKADTLKIVFHHEHEDVQQAMQARGLA